MHKETHGMRLMTRTFTALAMAAGLSLGATPAVAQQAPAGGSVYQRFAPIDLTGTWVSIVTEDWHLRMITPPKGAFENFPLTPAARQAAQAADPAAMQAAGQACMAYATPTIMREPGRVRIAWEDGDTLKIETDAGQQTRLLHFANAPAPGERSWQGHSVASWTYSGGFDPRRVGESDQAGNNNGGRRGRAPQAPQGGKLEVTTTNLRAGYLRKNGIPFSQDAVVTEYFNLITEPDGTRWFVVTTRVHDPENLVVDYITSTNFRREPDGSKWDPTPCSLQ